MKGIGLPELKKRGMIPQREEGFFSVRLHGVGGDLDTQRLEAIRTAADRFGRGRVHLTVRQGVEIPGVPRESLSALKEFLEPLGLEIGGAGPTVRSVTACPGCRSCPRGVIDSPSLARAIDREFYGTAAPHKVKIGISGCPNNCIKAEENDAGFKGWIEPRLVPGAGCQQCGICRSLCPAGAIACPEDGAPSIDLAACIGCGICIAACPAGCVAERRRGYAVFAGGKFGRIPVLGKRLPVLLETEEKAVAAVAAVLAFFREQGKPRERLADTLGRTGFAELSARVRE